MNNWTRFFLVLLRLVIGWHFLFEGLEKLNAPSWSSEAYLRESSGPLAAAFQRMAGDSVIDRVTPRPVPEGRDPATVAPHERFPAALDKEWQAYFDRFAKHYHLEDEQRRQVEAKLVQLKDQYVTWLLQGTKKVARSSPYGPSVSVERTMEERVRECQQKLQESRELQAQELPRTASTVFATEAQVKLRAAKADANRIRSEIRGEVDARTAAMKEALHDLRPPVSPDYPPMPTHVRPGLLSMSLLDVTDVVVPWGLTATGVCLLVGLFTRTFCLVGAAFLLLFYLAMPPLGASVPENLRAEGHYLYINKNIVEMLALLTLATTLSGRWCGLDGLVQFLNPRRWRRQPVPETSPRGSASRR